MPQDWTTLSVDGSHIDVTATCPCAATSSTWGGCVITYGANPACQLFSEPALAVADADLYPRKHDDPSNEVLIAGSLLGALRTVREVERLADAVEQLPDDKPALALLDGTLAFWDLQRGNCPRYVAEHLVGQRFQTTLARLRAASTDRRPVAVAAYTSRPRTTEGAGAVRLMLCEQDDDDCNRLCSARRSELAPCGWAAGFDDREMFELLLDRDTARPCINPATWPPASPWASPWASSGTTSTTSTAAPRSPASRSPTVWPRTLNYWRSAMPCWSSSASWVWAIRCHLRGPRAGGDLRPRPGGVPPHGPHAPGTARPAHHRISQGIFQALALGLAIPCHPTTLTGFLPARRRTPANYLPSSVR